MSEAVLPSARFSQASDIALQVDRLFIAMAGLSMLVTLIIGTLLVCFCWRYRRDAEASRENRTLPAALEYTWIGVPTVIFIGFFVWGALVFLQSRERRPEALELLVIAEQWMWMVYHPAGVRELNGLHLPVDRDIRLVLASEDVIHSFFVPAFRVKQDAVPGRFNQVWFRPTRTGRFRLLCAEYCGTNHSEMHGFVEVMAPDAYQQWLSERDATEPEEPEEPVDAGGAP